MKCATFSCLIFMLIGLMPTAAYAQVNGRVLDAGKGATGLVLLEGNRGSGSCFCIDAKGYFVTNAHVVRGETGAAIIMNPNTDDEFELKAKVVIRDGDSDLALLKADMGKHKVTPLKLADSNKLRETDELVAFGFPLGELLAFKQDEYPAVSVNVGRVTSLRKSDGQLEAIQTDATVTFGNSGGPMLDKRGDVAGVVVAGLTGVDINFAIPMHKVEALLEMPAVTVTLPEKIAFNKQFEPVAAKIEVKDIRGTGGGPFSVNVTVGSDDDAKTVKATGRGGSFVAGVQAAEKPKNDKAAAKTYEVDLQLDTGAMTVNFKDLPLRVGKHRLRLKDVALVEKKGDTYHVFKTDGTKLTGDTLTGPTVTTEIEGKRTRIALSKATWIRVFHEGLGEGKGYTVPVTVQVMRGGKEVAKIKTFVRVDDPVKFDLPDAPGIDLDNDNPPSDPDSGTDTPSIRISKGDYRFDAKRDRRLKGWTANKEMPTTSRGELLFKDQFDLELTFEKAMLLESMTIEYETEERTAFSVVYGENRYRVHVADNWIGMMDAKWSKDRPQAKGEADAKGRKKFTIAFPNPSITTMTMGKTTIAKQMNKPGEIKILIENRNPMKIHRIEMKSKSGDGLVVEASAYQPPVDAAGVQSNDTTIKLPDPYKSFDVGGGGRYMLFHVPSKKSIVIVDPVQAKIVHTMENISDDVIIAAGLEHFVLVLPGQKIIQKWAYEGFRRVKVARLPGNGQTRWAKLGTNSIGPLLLFADDVTMVDMQSLREEEMIGEKIGKRHEPVHLSADGHTLGVVEGSGYKVFHFIDTFVRSSKIGEQGYARRFAKPSADGRLIFCLNSRVFDNAVNEIAVDPLKGMTCYPTVDPRYFLAVQMVESKRDKHTIHVNVCTTADRKIIDTTVGMPEMAPTKEHNHVYHVGGWLRDGLPQFHYLPWANAMVSIPWDKKSVRIRKYDLIETLTSKGLDILFVQSVPPVYAPRAGKLAYQIDAVSSAQGITYELLDGPEGVKVSNSGLVTWDIPALSENEKETIILSVRNKAGEEVLHSFDLTYQ